MAAERRSRAYTLLSETEINRTSLQYHQKYTRLRLNRSDQGKL